MCMGHLRQKKVASQQLQSTVVGYILKKSKISNVHPCPNLQIQKMEFQSQTFAWCTTNTVKSSFFQPRTTDKKAKIPNRSTETQYISCRPEVYELLFSLFLCRVSLANKVYQVQQDQG